MPAQVFPALEAPVTGEFTQTPPKLPTAGAAVRSLIGTAIGEQRSIFQAVPGQETDPQHSAVRTLASRTTRLSLAPLESRRQGF